VLEDRIRIRWSDFEYGHPIRLRITNWKTAKIIYSKYFLVNSEMEYKGKLIELCVPYHKFIDRVRKLPVKQQRWIVTGKAIIELEKLPFSKDFGMRINKVEKVVTKL